MHPDKQDIAFKIVTEILFNRIGEGKAATIGELCNLVDEELSTPWGDDGARRGGFSRRAMEQLLELKIGDFPFPVISTSSGYFRPASVDEINHCLASLQSRALCIFQRKRTIIRNAIRSGYGRQGKRFVDSRESNSDLFDRNDRQEAQA